jgi:hypothetical protein
MVGFLRRSVVMGRQPTAADEGMGPILELLAQTIKKKHIKLQDVSVKIGKAPSWFSGVLVRRQHMYFDDFLAVCRVADIDPVLMLAARQEGGMLRYIREVPLVDILDFQMRAYLAEKITEQGIIVPMKAKPTGGKGKGGGDRDSDAA